MLITNTPRPEAQIIEKDLFSYDMKCRPYLFSGIFSQALRSNVRALLFVKPSLHVRAYVRTVTMFYDSMI